MEPLRVCKKCGLEAYTRDDLENFVSCPDCKYGRSTQCKGCRRKLKVKKRWGEVKKYGCTAEEYDARMATSDVCQICGSKNNLCYDHEHTKEKKFRGVLCRSCNRHLGGLGDNLEGIMRVVKYLQNAD